MIILPNAGENHTSTMWLAFSQARHSSEDSPLDFVLRTETSWMNVRRNMKLRTVSDG